MPGCVLRAAGVDFNLDGFLKSSALTPCNVYRKGELKGARGKRNETSGLTVVVSDASGDDLGRQIEDAKNFLRQHQAEIRRLLNYEGVEGASLDFGVLRKSEFVNYFYFPPDLLRLSGDLALGIELSVYVAGEDGQT